MQVIVVIEVWLWRGKVRGRQWWGKIGGWKGRGWQPREGAAAVERVAASTGATGIPRTARPGGRGGHIRDRCGGVRDWRGCVRDWGGSICDWCGGIHHVAVGGVVATPLVCVTPLTGRLWRSGPLLNCCWTSTAWGGHWLGVVGAGRGGGRRRGGGGKWGWGWG